MTLDELRRLGLDVYRDGDHLKVAPAAAITPQLRAAIQASRQQLLWEIDREEEERVWRAMQLWGGPEES